MMFKPHFFSATAHGFRLRRVTLAALLAAGALCAGPKALAGPAVAHWSVTDLGSLGGSSSNAAYAINNLGQVAGGTTTASGQQHAFLYSSGVMTDLGGGLLASGRGMNDGGSVVGIADGLNGFFSAFLYQNGTLSGLAPLNSMYSIATGINAAGQVALTVASAGMDTQHAMLYSAGRLSDLGTLGGPNSGANAINAAGQVTGFADRPLELPSNTVPRRAFIYRDGVMIDLGSLGGSYSEGFGINASGQVTGSSSFADGSLGMHAFAYANGSMTDLGTLGGRFSVGSAINSAGLITGTSSLAGSPDSHAFLYTARRMVDLNTLNGVAGSGWTLQGGNGINDRGQVVGGAMNAAGQGRAYLATLDTTVWEGSASGSWTDTASWSFGIAPNTVTGVVIDPTRSLTVLGPASDVSITTLQIGGNPGGGNGITTLSLNGGTITTLAAGGVRITAKGVLTGDGVIAGAVSNDGTVLAQNLTLSNGLSNQGLVTGTGRLNTTLTNSATGLVQVGAGQSLILNSAGGHLNLGQIEVTSGGSLSVNGRLDNAGQLSVIGSTLRMNALTANNSGGNLNLSGGSLVHFNGGLTNAGQLNISFGGAQVFGDIANASGGKLIFSGNSNSALYGKVEVQSGAELRVSSGSTAVFFAPVQQRTGARLTGSGNKFYEGGLTVGASPGYVLDEGNVGFGADNTYTAEIGGLSACSAACETDAALRDASFDKYVVLGHLELGGQLKLVSWNGFVAQSGQRFDLLDWGGVSGSFDSIDASGFALAAGTVLDTSRLYIDGSIGVSAVPEPAGWAMWLVGLLSLLAHRRAQTFHPPGVSL